ncbi:protein CcmA, bactofilin family [Haladaptatus litoreus]|uniref:Protein CcmA, bactofilin family n=1 Tax=Haladaptatus litoreus TaxID=553468 RepID=A0A1N7BPQ9_9EURY|nr:polymer-forming cytoskeletal protein [Haladaptatus litoreus]SIR53154.1 protein CcmA, bactofilin family [Haladaptatus litoreus]
MRAKATLLVVFLLIVTLPATAAAEQTRTAGTVVVAEGETINDDLSATAGSVVVRGTVNGDLSALAGNVLVAETGTVSGDVSALAGNVRIEGTVTGNVESGGGNFVLAQTGTIGGSLEGAAGYSQLAGTVGGDVQVASETLAITETATIDGNLVYDAETFERAPGATIGGTVRQDESMADVGPTPVPQIPNWVGTLYGFFVNLLLGVLLLAVFPTFSDGVAERARSEPLFSAGVGLLLLILVPIALVLFAITIIGIPISLLGALLFGIVLWIGTVYGALTVGVWLLSLADRTNRWLALLVGLLVVAILTQIPIFGGLVQFLVLLLGLGALAIGVRARYRGRRITPEYAETTDTGTDEESTTA